MAEVLSPGTVLGRRYRLAERIAGGGMGDVWRATDEVLGRTVAVKVLLPALLDEPGFAERFRGEARTMATINHPGVVDVYDYGSDEGTAFLVMEYIEGDALSRTLARVGRLTPARTMALVAQAADALHAAHEKGIVHRDVKPGNLLVRPNGTLVLTDFGIARSADVGQLTVAGSVLGTASYISPEQAAGQPATALSDVYALGVVAYQCLAGRRPFEGDNPLEIATRHVRDDPPPLPSDIPPPARQVVERAMAKDPAARWPTAAALAQVARRTASQLLAGVTARAAASPISGPPAAPSSGPPASPSAEAKPSSGPPASGRAAASTSGPPAGPVSPGGTRIMDAGAAAAGPTPPRPGGPPSGGAGSPPGQFARAAPRVPPRARRADTGYPSVPTGAPPAPAQPARGRPGTGSRRSGAVLLVALGGLLLAALCVGGGIYFLNNASQGNGGDPGPGLTQQSSANTAMVRIDCQGLTGKLLGEVRPELQGQGFKVAVKRVDGGGRDNEVLQVPCQATRGSTVEVTVSTGRGKSGPGNGEETCRPGIGGAFGRSCPPSPRS